MQRHNLQPYHAANSFAQPKNIMCNHLESPELSPNRSSLSTRLRLELRLVWSVQEDGDRIRSIFCSMVWFMEEAAVLPLGALIVKTPSELIVEVTRSA